jgi:uncharacterized protein YecE (DUF72 family)
LQLYVGCSGFSYSAWLNHFYPPELATSKWLEYYSKVFDYVEIDSSFHRIPDPLTVKRWATRTPENFKFTAKMPQAATHEKRLGLDVEGSLHYFYEAMWPLKSKLLCVLLQLPPSFTKKEGFKKLKTLPLDNRFRHTIEVRHKSWFDDEVYDYLKEANICLVWSQLAELQTPPVVTTDFVYLRFIGDRSIDDKDFGRIQIDRKNEVQYWASQFEKLKNNNKALKIGVVAANNHYAGFGPGTANTFRKMSGLSEGKFYELGKPADEKQASLLDFK